MDATAQSVIALVIVAGAVAFLLRGAFAKRRHPGCGGGCGCPSDKLKSPRSH